MKHIVLFLCVCALWLGATESQAHFGIVIPSASTVPQKENQPLEAIIAFAHPFTGQGLEMARPKNVFLAGPNGKRVDLTASLEPFRFMEKNAWKTAFKPERPGSWQIAVVPEPYFEASEDCFIIHYAKTVLGAYGSETGWNHPLGLPMEIAPLIRPYANYAGNLFAGIVLRDGKPLPNAPIEVEFLNIGNKYKAPNEYFETQQLQADENGYFAFSVPWPGWWGFAALSESAEKMEKDGAPKDVELGAILWLEFAEPQKAEK